MGVGMNEDKPVRVQKAIADKGLASRREAEKWIEEGRVTVNGSTVSLGDKCLPSLDVINIDGISVPKREPKRIVIAMNKPTGYVCTNEDPHAKRTVFDLLPPELAAMRLFCVGRLDMESEGLILLTNDGDLRQKLAHPSYHVVKKYSVELDKPLREDDIPKLIRGIQWENQRLSLDKVFPLGGRLKKNWKVLEVTLHHGRKREIRRVFYAFGYEVKTLKRFQIGEFRLKGIPRGKSKMMDKKDVQLLFERHPGAKGRPRPEGP